MVQLRPFPKTVGAESSAGIFMIIHPKKGVRIVYADIIIYGFLLLCYGCFSFIKGKTSQERSLHAEAQDRRWAKTAIEAPEPEAPRVRGRGRGRGRGRQGRRAAEGGLFMIRYIMMETMVITVRFIQFRYMFWFMMPNAS